MFRTWAKELEKQTNYRKRQGFKQTGIFKQ